MSSESDNCRDRLLPYVSVGCGLDLGFGGSKPLNQSAICIDREPNHPERHREDKPWPTHLIWDIFRPLPFADDTFSWIFSSHALEDARHPREVLKEWLRILKPTGNLVLYLPDQQAYERVCKRNGSLPNQAHVHPDFSLAYVKARLNEVGGNRIIYEHDCPVPGSEYSFEIVAMKL